MIVLTAHGLIWCPGGDLPVMQEPTHSQTVALRAVREGRVRKTNRGRLYPPYVRAAALDAAHRRGWWRWAEDEDIARITAEGQRAIEERGL